MNLSRLACFRSLLVLVAIAGGRCAPPPGAANTPVSPIYNPRSGRLEQIVSDRNGDGIVDTRAFMDGPTLQRIELDRNGDSRPDRWEYYRKVELAGAALPVEIERAEEANASDQRITRREFYAAGTVSRVEEDTDADGRVDKWEHYDHELLARIELDLNGAGFPDRRMLYRRDGSVEKVEVGDATGTWRPFAPTQ